MTNRKIDPPFKTTERKAKRHMGIKASTLISNTLIYIVLVIISLIWLFPFVCIVLQSFEAEHTHISPTILPKVFGFKNYVTLWNHRNFKTWYVNTFIIAAATALGQTVMVLCMSYTLSRFRFKMRKTLMKIMLVLGLFPGMLTMIILFRVLSDLGLSMRFPALSLFISHPVVWVTMFPRVSLILFQNPWTNPPGSMVRPAHRF